MSNDKNSNKSNNNSNTTIKFNEAQAYEELRLIFAIAIETQNFNGIEAKIAAWENKYPLAEFTDPEIIRRIKTILNKDFLSRLIGDYLASKVLHEKQKQNEAYLELKNIIDSAKKSKDYKTAQLKINGWKNKLKSNGLSIYSFDRFYRSKVCTLLLLPSSELKNQQEATLLLKSIKDRSTNMTSNEYLNEITSWQNKYALNRFPERLQKDLNAITTEAFKSIEEKRNQESAIKELENFTSASVANVSPADSISQILSKYNYKNFDNATKSKIEQLTLQAMSYQGILEESAKAEEGEVDNLLTTLALTSVQLSVINDLKSILSKSPHDTNAILNWIYTNRKITFSEFARNEIIQQFTVLGYRIPKQASFYIPEINTDLAYQNFSDIDKIREKVILNYLGILSQGHNISHTDKDNLLQIHSTSEKENLISTIDKKPTIILPVFDNEPTQSNDEQMYNESGEISEEKEEEAIYNIFIEDIIDDPLATYTIATSSYEEPTQNDKDYTYSQSIDESNLEVDINLSSTSSIDTTPATDLTFDTNISSLDENISDNLPTTNIKEENENSSALHFTSSESTKEIYIPVDNKKEDNDSTISSENEDSKYSLTLEDQKNVADANSLSSYIVVASPLLDMVFSHEKSLELSENTVTLDDDIEQKK